MARHEIDSHAFRFLAAASVSVPMGTMLTPLLWEICYGIGSSVISDEIYDSLKRRFTDCGALAGLLTAIAVAIGKHQKPGLLSSTSAAFGFSAALGVMFYFRWPCVLWTYWLAPTAVACLLPLCQQFCETLKTDWNRTENLVDRV